MTVVLVVAASLLGIASILLVVRLTIGPTILDRSMALDVMMAVMVCAVALWSAHTDEVDLLPMLLVLSTVGFVGSVGIARYASGVDDVEAELSAEDPVSDRSAHERDRASDGARYGADDRDGER
ncbi:monovalent cation/H+ antiporter complex subunit F [Nocardioides houyundeii]|uniref:monovalent cation/H+ antiporter complex subunit F n=1 Tax=Nocardioides houyundeii TaxID=2045452 RepID=UPI000C78BC0C|nr:monovalent cation/H+ antiporter complex subunit F [Nocardioides houyundeii]